MVSTDIGTRSYFATSHRWKSWLLTHHPLMSLMWGIPHCNWMWGEIRAPHLAFTDWIRIELWFYLWYFVGIGQLLSFCLTRLPFCDFFGLERTNYSGASYCCYCGFYLFLVFLGCGFSSTQSRIQGQKENPANPPPCHSLGPKACLLLSTFQSLLFLSCTMSKQCLCFFNACI